MHFSYIYIYTHSHVFLKKPVKRIK